MLINFNNHLIYHKRTSKNNEYSLVRLSSSGKTILIKTVLMSSIYFNFQDYDNFSVIRLRRKYIEMLKTSQRISQKRLLIESYIYKDFCEKIKRTFNEY